MSTIDPNSLFANLQRDLGAQSPSAGGGTTNEKLAAVATITAGFDANFFKALSAGDKTAKDQLGAFVSSASEAGMTGDDIDKFLVEKEAACATGAPATTTTTAPGAPGGDGSDGSDLIEAIFNKAAADECAENSLAQAMGITVEQLDSYVDGADVAAIYEQGRAEAAGLIAKIANEELPSSEEFGAALLVCQEHGIDTKPFLDALAASAEKLAATTSESTAVKLAREAAQAEDDIFGALDVLLTFGVGDAVEKMAAEAIEKKKMSAGKKALLIGAGTAGASALGLAALGKVTKGKFNPMEGARAIRSGEAMLEAKGRYNDLKAGLRGRAAAIKAKISNPSKKQPSVMTRAYARNGM